MPTKTVLKAKYDFQTSEAEELKLVAGDTITLIFKDDSGWAKGIKPNGEKGWFPVDYTEVLEEIEEPAPPIETTAPAAAAQEMPKLSDSEKQRFNIVSELLATETTYLKGLVKIIKLWMVPLKEAKVIEERYIPKIFANVEDVHNVHQRLFLDLEARISKWSETQTIGDVFVSYLPEFVVYEEYLKNHHTAILTVNALRDSKKAFAQWMQIAKDSKESEGLDLLAYLIMPVQRILRYKLLLEDLIKRTKDNHPDFLNLVHTMSQIGAIAVNVNEAIKEEENFATLCRIQKNFVGNVKNIVVEGRRFVREGSVMKVCRKTNKARWFFLFNDILVYASVAVGNLSGTIGRSKTSTQLINRKSLLNSASQGQRMLAQNNDFQNKYLYHRAVSLRSTKVKSLEDTPTLANAFQILTSEEKSFVVFTETPQDKEAWMKDFRQYTSGGAETSAPVWVQDKDAKTCMSCAKAFNVVQRRHHCRYCGKVVCGACSSQSIKVATISQKPVRVCKICYDELKNAKNDSTPSTHVSFVPDEEEEEEQPNLRASSPSISPAKPVTISKAVSQPKLTVASSPSKPELPAKPTLPKPDADEPKSDHSPTPERRVESPRPDAKSESKPEPKIESPRPDSKPEPKPELSVTKSDGEVEETANQALPPKPQTLKPSLKPKPSDTDVMRKKLDTLTKLYEDEVAARINSEKVLRDELEELRAENNFIRGELEWLKNKMLQILDPPTRPVPKPADL